MKASTLRHLINLWPPFLLAGIHATRLTADYRAADVELRMRWYNRNYVGVHFGGSLFSMTDPWYMLMLLHNLGKDYLVWDRHAEIDYIAPGRGVVSARFRLSESELTQIVDNTAGGEKYLPEFSIEVVDQDNALVARVRKQLYVRRKASASR